MNKSLDYPIQHFEQIRELAIALKKLPAQVQDHHYSYNSFGSWYTIIRYKGKFLRIVYDGRDSVYSIQHSLPHNQQDWSDNILINSNEISGSIPVNEIIKAVQNSV